MCYIYWCCCFFFPELENESKIFGNDQEFFHVQRDPNDVPGFRDSGYYDGILDSRISLDTKPGLAALDESMKVTSKEKSILKEINGQNLTDVLKDSVTKLQYTDIPKQAVEHDMMPVNINKGRPALLMEEISEIKQVSTEKDKKIETPSSVGHEHSTSDSEYQSGQEDLSLNLDSPSTPNSDIMESSVDTGEVFPSESQTDDKNDVDKAAENCTIS